MSHYYLIIYYLSIYILKVPVNFAWNFFLFNRNGDFYNGFPITYNNDSGMQL